MTSLGPTARAPFNGFPFGAVRRQLLVSGVVSPVRAVNGAATGFRAMENREVSRPRLFRGPNHCRVNLPQRLRNVRPLRFNTSFRRSTRRHDCTIPRAATGENVKTLAKHDSTPNNIGKIVQEKEKRWSIGPVSFL